MLARRNRYLANWSLSLLSSTEFTTARENAGTPETVPVGGDDPSNGDATETIPAVVPSDGSANERKEIADATGSSNDGSFCFPRFDIGESPPDHHYLDTADQVRFTKPAKVSYTTCPKKDVISLSKFSVVISLSKFSV